MKYDIFLYNAFTSKNRTMLKKYDKIIDRVFIITVSIKAFNGVVELISAVALVLIPKDFLINNISKYISEEFAEDPNNMISSWMMNFAAHIRPDTQHFIIIYIAIHGMINLGLATALFGKNHKAYFASMIVLILFIVYQIHRLTFTYSVILFIFIILDILTVFLIHYEYKKLLPKHQKK